MIAVTLRLGVLTALTCWLGHAQAPGTLPPGTQGSSADMAGLVAGLERRAPARLDDTARNALAVGDVRLEAPATNAQARAYGLGPLASLAAAWNDALDADREDLPGLFTPQAAEVRERFVNAPDNALFFSVEQACLAVGCMTEFALSPTVLPATGVSPSMAQTDGRLLPQAPAVVPIPPALLLFGSAVGLLAWWRRPAA